MRFPEHQFAPWLRNSDETDGRFLVAHLAIGLVLRGCFFFFLSLFGL